MDHTGNHTEEDIKEQIQYIRLEGKINLILFAKNCMLIVIFILTKLYYEFVKNELSFSIYTLNVY